MEKSKNAPWWLLILAFLFPIVGFIYWAVQIGPQPERAKSVGGIALIGFIIGFLVQLASGPGAGYPV